MITPVDFHPPLGLIIRTPRLILQPADEPCALRLAMAVLEHGIHDTNHSPFGTQWSDADATTVARRVFTDSLPKTHERLWKLSFAVRLAGTPDTPIGVVVLRQDGDLEGGVCTASWFVRPMHGNGLGTETRAALLKLAFDGMGADYASSLVFTNNTASLGVTQKFGYTHMSSEMREVRGSLEEYAKMTLTREQWRGHLLAQSLGAEVLWEGLVPVLDYFGIASALDEEQIAG